MPDDFVIVGAKPRWHGYRKSITAAIGAVIATIPLVWDLAITEGEAITLVTVWATAFGVYQLPNDDD